MSDTQYCMTEPIQGQDQGHGGLKVVKMSLSPPAVCM